jgi:hypothetical protein
MDLLDRIAMGIKELQGATYILALYFFNGKSVDPTGREHSCVDLFSQHECSALPIYEFFKLANLLMNGAFVPRESHNGPDILKPGK